MESDRFNGSIRVSKNGRYFVNENGQPFFFGLGIRPGLCLDNIHARRQSSGWKSVLERDSQ